MRRMKPMRGVAFRWRLLACSYSATHRPLAAVAAIARLTAMSGDNDPRKLVPLVWVPIFEFGVPDIDDEHRALLVDINELTRLLANEPSWPDVAKICRKLYDECVSHFRDEHALLQQTRFGHIAAHLEEHRRTELLLSILIEAIESVTEPSRQHVEMALFVRSMLVDHFFRYDIGYKSHVMNARGR